MAVIQASALEPITRDRWVKIVERTGSLLEDSPLRRRSPRYHIDKEVRVHIHPSIGARKKAQEVLCSVIEISSGGMMLRARQEMRDHTRLTIEWTESDRTLALSGSVRHCTGTVGGFKVGVKLDFASPEG